jgi:signal peptidase
VTTGEVGGAAVAVRARNHRTAAAHRQDGALHRAPGHARTGWSLRDVALAAVGAPGVLVAAWLVASWALSASLVVLVTGSMSPGMPAGTAAVVRTTPAADLRVGDVVTVPRGDGARVTHRVVAIDDVPGQPQERLLTLQGDANRTTDRDPYRVATAGRVVASLPGAGRVLETVRQPAVAGAGVLLVAALVAWALWPERPRDDDRRAVGARGTTARRTV